VGVDAQQHCDAMAGPGRHLVGVTPAANQVDRQAWRRSYGRRAKGELSCSGLNAAARAIRSTLGSRLEVRLT
jgi:hypothetical protein